MNQSTSARTTSVTFTFPYYSMTSRINRNCIYFTAVTEQLIQLLNKVPSSHNNICLFLQCQFSVSIKECFDSIKRFCTVC